jgi:nucleoside-diphosphate-sugar epimerase
MRIFVAGASGVIGRALLPSLLAAGHQTVGMTRSPEKAQRIASVGAQPVVCDVYDRTKLCDVVREARSEVVVHLLTDLPTKFSPRAGTEPTNRIRREGTRNLLEAARAAGARRVIAESVAFLYDPAGDRLKREQDAPWSDAPGAFAETVRALVDLETQVLEAPALEGIVLRFGWLYGPGTWYDPAGAIGKAVRRRMYPIVGTGAGRWSFVHVADAATAVISALGDGEAGVYNVVDDEPAPMHAWVPAFAEAIGAPRPLRFPRWLARGLGGTGAVNMAERLAGADNAKAKKALSWAPSHASWRDGFQLWAETSGRQATLG